MPADAGGLSAADCRQLAARGIDPDDAARQLALLRSPPAHRRLVRPCTPGDGIRRLTTAEQEEALVRFREEARRGRACKMVAAAGAATRMFADLTALWRERPAPSAAALAARARGGDPRALDGLRLQRELQRFPFAPQLLSGARRAGFEASDPAALPALLELLLGPAGLDFAATPKALLPFHRRGGQLWTALEEQMAEGGAFLLDGTGGCRLHFTAAPEEAARFTAALAEARRRLEPALGVHFDVGLSTQDPATHTLAVDSEGQPFRCADGSLLLRPGGHGAMLANLGRLGGDLVFIKNIDNVLPARRHAFVGRWLSVLGGVLVALEERVRTAQHRLRRGDFTAAATARELLHDAFGVTAPTPGDGLEPLLDRPLRVCGVVAHAGEPGGGPFWVAGGDGAVRPQIVEQAEVAAAPDQQRIAAGATHFNPVLLACALRDAAGRPFALSPFADPEAVIVAAKSHEGRPLRALERPGLWNGAMARWNTAFVEVPAEVFAPVKTVFDLLRPEHQEEEFDR